MVSKIGSGLVLFSLLLALTLGVAFATDMNTSDKNNVENNTTITNQNNTTITSQNNTTITSQNNTTITSQNNTTAT